MDRALAEIGELTMSAGTRPVETLVPGLTMIKGAVPPHQLTALYRPMIGLVVQGAKILAIAGREIQVRGPSYFLLPLHAPLRGRVRPGPDGSSYLSLGLRLNQDVLRALLRDVQGDLGSNAPRGFAACEAGPEMIEAWLRLLRLSRTPTDVPALAPVYEREIVYRALAGPQGWYLRQLGFEDGNLSRVSRAVQELRERYTEPIDIADLAAAACMARTTFHREFKRATGLSPIQFQKRLRLLEARNLLAFGGQRAATAAHAVGYESASQFSRDYSRFFGAPPARDAAALRRAEAARID